MALSSRRAAAAWGREQLLPRVPGSWGAAAWASWAARMPARAGHDLGQNKEERMGRKAGWSGKGAGLVVLAGQEEKGGGRLGWLVTWAKRRRRKKNKREV